MSSTVGFALFEGLAVGVGLAILYLTINLISKLFKKLGEGPKTERHKQERNDEGRE